MSEFDSTEAVASELQRLHDAAAEAIVAHQNEKGRADKLQKQLDQAIALLRECHEYIEPQSDVSDGDYGVPHANRAMSLCQSIDTILNGHPY